MYLYLYVMWYASSNQMNVRHTIYIKNIRNYYKLQYQGTLTFVSSETKIKQSRYIIILIRC